jgi:hypothetical protein
MSSEEIARLHKTVREALIDWTERLRRDAAGNFRRK